MTDWWWLAPVLSLLGALFGGVISALVSGVVGERRLELALIREARIALERWYATRMGPQIQAYPGLDSNLLKTVSDDAMRAFFDRHFHETHVAKAALGAVRHVDGRIASMLDKDDWRIPDDKIDELRDALVSGELRTRRLRRDRPALR